MRPPRGAGHALAVGDAVDEVLPLRRAWLQGGSWAAVGVGVGVGVEVGVGLGLRLGLGLGLLRVGVGIRA